MSLRAKNLVDILSRFLVLIVVMAIMTIMAPGVFLSWSNISNVVFSQTPFTLLMAFGMSLAIISKGIDISMASNMVLCAYLSGSYFSQGNHLMGILVAFGVGAGFGLINGILISKVKIEPFVATFSVDFMALGLAYVACDGKYIYGFPSGFRALTDGTLIPGVPNVALITAVVFAILYFLTKHTTYGRVLYSLGYNSKAARLSGMPSENVAISVYIINGLLAALTGILYLARLNAADPSIKGTLTIDSLASALIGGIAFGGGKGSVVNTIIGALVIMFIRNGLNILNVSINWQQTVVGAVILLSVFYERGLNILMTRIADKRGQKAG